MKKIWIILLACLSWGLNATAQQNAPRGTTTQLSPADKFQHQLEKLYKAVSEQNNTSIRKFEVALHGSMREAIHTRVPDARLQQRMEQILAAFEGFTFVDAKKETIDEHLALLEEFLAIMRA